MIRLRTHAAGMGNRPESRGSSCKRSPSQQNEGGAD